jgi:hypothetical protein
LIFQVARRGATETTIEHCFNVIDGLILSGSASDQEDGEVIFDQMKWKIGNNNYIGASVYFNSLTSASAQGDYYPVSLCVTDSGGEKSCDSTTIVAHGEEKNPPARKIIINTLICIFVGENLGGSRSQYGGGT